MQSQINKPKVTSYESIKTYAKIAARCHFYFSVSRACKVEWDARAMDSPREKTNTSYLKDGAYYCYCAHLLRVPGQSRATRKKCATHRTRGLILSPVSLGGSSSFLWKRCVVFQQMKNNFYLPCQFFENRRSMRMLLFLLYDRSDRTFFSQTKVNFKTSKVIASRCYALILGIKKSLKRKGPVNRKENSCKSSA